MTFEAFVNLIPKIQKMSIPGESAHYMMAPEIRLQELNKIKIEQFNPRHAAVMMLLYPKDGITHIALILRPEYEGVHSGQVALPGGKAEQEDNDFQETALRETWEEIGVVTNAIKVIKPLTKVYIPPSNFWVHPFLGYTAETPDFILQKEEVAQIIEVKIEDLFNDNNVIMKQLSTSYANNIDVPSFKLNSYTVWGATAMMLSELKVFLSQAIQR